MPSLDMQRSPLDRPQGAAPAVPLVPLTYRPSARWIPSRFNARTVGDDGRLILWNSLTGAINVYEAEHRDAVLDLLSVEGLPAPLGGAAEYLERRGYLVRADVDELDLFRFRFAQEQWRSDILQLVLMASEDCNFRCIYYYKKFKHNTMLPEVRQGIRAMVQQRAAGLKELGIMWFGGEPLYGWEAVEELAPFFAELGERTGITVWQNMTTNGYLLDDERAGKLLSWGCRSFQITVDGLPEEHDRKRIGRDGSPTCEVILANLRALHRRSETFHVNLRVNFDHENLPRMGAFIESLSEDFGNDPRFKLAFHAVGRWGGPNDAQLAVCGTREERDGLREMRTEAQEADLCADGGIERVARQGSQACYAARPYNFVVSATGKLMKCTVALDEMEENVVGRIHPDGTVEIDQARLSRWVRPHFEGDSMCQSCHLLPGCEGAACP
ncbi:MAG TPA: radical SAM protein, partial [Longimicrobium sp.]|nr:radical SAM protein [Longimicrobium sp.]